MKPQEAVELVCAALRAISGPGQFDALVLDAGADLRALAIDSIQFLECVGLVEEVCGCGFPDDSLDWGIFRTIADIAAMVVRHVPYPVVAPPGGWEADTRFKRSASTAADIAQETRIFGHIQDVLANRARWPLSGPVVKMLKFMLQSDEGCDATITTRTFRVVFGWHDGPCDYQPALAIGVFSYLLTLGNISEPVTEVRLRLAPADVHGPPDDDGGWSHGARDVWICNEGERVRMTIRNAAIQTT